MAMQKDETVQAVAKLIKLTQEGGLKWEAGNPSGDLRNRDGFEVKFVFLASYKDRSLRLYGYRERIEDPGPFGYVFTAPTSTGGLLSHKERTYPYWEDGVALEITDSVGRSQWEFPSDSSVYDLLRAIRYQVAGVKEFLEEILKE